MKEDWNSNSAAICMFTFMTSKRHMFHFLISNWLFYTTGIEFSSDRQVFHLKWLLFCIRNLYKINTCSKTLHLNGFFRLAEQLRAKLPDATPTELAELVNKRSKFASNCCFTNSPPLYCDSEVGKCNPLPNTAESFKNICTQIYSFLSCYWDVIMWQAFPGVIITWLSLQWK